MNVKTLLSRARRLLDPQFAAAAVVALVVEIGLSISTVPRVARLLGIRLARDDDAEPVEVPADIPTVWIRRRYVEVNRVLRRWPFGNTCLRRALVLGQRIRRLDPVLVIGVRHGEDGQLAAHAWLVVGDIALDPLAAHYAPLQELQPRLSG